jgi:hypothetical protein
MANFIRALCAVTLACLAHCSPSNSQSPVPATTGTPDASADTDGGDGGLPNAVAFALGLDGMCILLADSTVACQGDGRLGQLGGGVKAWQPTPARVLTSKTGLGPDGPPLTNVTQITADCALMSDTTVYCWGDGAVRGWGSDGAVTWATQILTYDQTYVPGPSTVYFPFSGMTQISVGSCACAVMQDSTAACWGSNTTGELGRGWSYLGGAYLNGAASYPIPLAVHTSGLQSPKLSGIAHVEVGLGFACALMKNGTVQCWGDDKA